MLSQNESKKKRASEINQLSPTLRKWSRIELELTNFLRIVEFHCHSMIILKQSSKHPLSYFCVLKHKWNKILSILGPIIKLMTIPSILTHTSPRQVTTHAGKD